MVNGDRKEENRLWFPVQGNELLSLVIYKDCPVTFYGFREVDLFLIVI